jgi:hypothetical protein
VPDVLDVLIVGGGATAALAAIEHLREGRRPA